MNKVPKFFYRSFLCCALGASLIACSDGEDGIDGTNGNDGAAGQDFTPQPMMFADKSALKPLVQIAPAFANTKAFSLISTSDRIGDGNFQLAGSADGSGFLKDDNGDGYIFVVNNEDHYATSRIFLDKNLIPVKGDYLLNSGVADVARQCSGTMWEKEIHGGSRDIFLSASESINYKVKGIDPRVVTPTPNADFGLKALGEFSWENAVPLPKNAFPGKTVIIGGDDDSSGSEGQVILYYSENGDADLDNGEIYVLRFKQVEGASGAEAVAAGRTYNESSLKPKSSYEVEFVKIENGKDMTKNEMEAANTAVNASQFMRVEDVDYGKGSDAKNRDVFFAVTGKGPGQGTYNDWGTVYRLELDPTSPLTGKLTQVVSGNTDTNNKDGELASLQSPDNLCVTENFIYFQEDPNSFSRNHNAYIYQSDHNGNNVKVVLRLTVDQNLAKDPGVQFAGEFGSLVDISDKVGVPGTFTLALQPHYWKDDFFKGLDGHDLGNNEDDQGSQIIILQNLPR